MPKKFLQVVSLAPFGEKLNKNYNPDNHILLVGGGQDK